MATDQPITDDDRAIVVAQQQSMDVDDYVPPPPLRIVRPDSLEYGQEKSPCFHYEEGAMKATTYITYKRRRGRPAGSTEPARSNIGQKSSLFHSSSSSCSYSKGDKDEDFEPLTPTRKRGRPSRSIYAKRKMAKEPLLVDSSSSEGKKDKEVSDGNGRKKYTCVQGSAWHIAKELQKKLPAEGPSFVKLMLHSHVVNGFWLGLPTVFSRNNLPKENVKIVLEDEEAHTCKTRYKAYKTGLSGGWRRFVEQHDLKVGDALVFQLVQPTRFKVYILRENKFTTTDGALGLLSLKKSMETNTSKKEEKGGSHKGTKPKKVMRKKKKKVPEVVTRVRGNPSSNDNTSEEAARGGIGDFVPVNSLKDFKIVVGDNKVVGRVVLPDHLRMTYYTLCHARNAFLHRHLLKQVCPTLATGMIVETATIADAIMACSADSLEDLASWKKTLGSFELLGMDVAFMRERVDELIDLLRTRSSAAREGYEKLKLERARLAERLRALESRLSAHKDDVKEMDVAMEKMVGVSAEKKGQAVRKLATAPW